MIPEEIETQNLKTRLTKEDIESYLDSGKILFAKISDLPDYKGTEYDKKFAYKTKDKTLKNGDRGDLPISEVENFLERDDGYTYGFVEMTSRKEYNEKGGIINAKPANINIKKLDKNNLDENKVEGCLIIFVSLKTEGENFVVGYYKNATIYKKRKDNPKYRYKFKEIYNTPCCVIEGILYFFKTENENAILLKKRFATDLKKDLHYGQSFLKYVDEKNIDYVRNEILNKLIDRI